jgi:hypothetical protein
MGLLGRHHSVFQLCFQAYPLQRGDLLRLAEGNEFFERVRSFRKFRDGGRRHSDGEHSDGGDGQLKIKDERNKKQNKSDMNVERFFGGR